MMGPHTLCSTLWLWAFVTYVCCCNVGKVAKGNGLFLPTRLSLQLSWRNRATRESGCFRSFSLTPRTPIAVLDYDHEVAGYPTFEVESLTQPVQIEVKYSEEAAGLSHPFSDGPFPFNVALSNTYRVETFNITEPGHIQAFFLQGGQRWQSIELITDGEVTFTSVGFVPSVPTTDVSDLPGSFFCNDEALNEIWKLGARAVSMSCVEAGSQNPIWEIDPQQGAFVRGMRPGVSARGAFFENYTLEFETKISRGGIGWVVAFPLASPMQGIQLNLISDNQPFHNFNHTLMRPNSVMLGYGYSLVNVTTLPSWHLGTFDVPFRISDEVWYRVKSVLGDESLVVYVNDAEIFKASLSDYPFLPTRLPGGRISPTGSFGFGGWQDQAGHIRNVVVRDTKNSSELYRNSMMGEPAVDILREYGVQANYEAACLDGPKRDRLVWLGDLLHTVRIVPASTARLDLLRGTLQLFLDWQTPSGLLPYAPPLGYDPITASNAFARGGGSYFMGAEVYGVILVDYQILGLLSFTDYIRFSNDRGFARRTWPQWVSNIQYLTDNINTTTGLLSTPGAFLGASQAGSAINCALAQAYHEMAAVAEGIGEKADSTRFKRLAISLSSNINQKLWDQNLGFYVNSLADRNGPSVTSTAFGISSRTASQDQTRRSISSLAALKLGPGYKDLESINSSDLGVKISPNTNGFLLSALLMQNSTATDAAEAANISLALMKSLWTPMISNSSTSTGASWEYVDQYGGPGLGLYTSLSHPWGGAPTYLLPQWVTGIQTAPGPQGFGYKEWVIDPYMGVLMGLKRSRASFMTPFGKLVVEWWLEDRLMHVTVRAPMNTKGIFRLQSVVKSLSGLDCYRFNVAI